MNTKETLINRSVAVIALTLSYIKAKMSDDNTPVTWSMLDDVSKIDASIVTRAMRELGDALQLDMDDAHLFQHTYTVVDLKRIADHVGVLSISSVLGLAETITCNYEVDLEWDDLTPTAIITHGGKSLRDTAFYDAEGRRPSSSSEQLAYGEDLQNVVPTPSQRAA